MVHRLLLLGLAMALLSCSPNATAVPNADWSNTTFATPLVLKLVIIRAVPSGQRCLQAGDSLQIQYTVIDDSKQSIILESTEQPILNVTIAEGHSMKVVYTWSDQKPDQVLRHIEWQPGESRGIEMQWNVPQNDKVSGYIIQGELSRGAKIIQVVPVNLCFGIPFEQR